MALSIKDDETDALVRELARRKKLSFTGAIRLAVSNELNRSDDAREAERERKRAVVRELQERWRALPDRMTKEEVDAWMYDESGLPH